MRWLKLYTEIVNDPKIRILAFEDRWHYVALLCAKAEGLLDSDTPIRERLIRVHLGLAELDADNLKKRLVEACLISDDWQPSGWQKRQAVDPTGAERQRRHRASKAAGSDVSRDSHVTVTQQSRSRVEKRREDKTLPSEERRRFTPPTLPEVSEFIASEGLRVNAEAFIAYYESKGWLVGKSRMKDWKAAARGWSSREKSGNGVNGNAIGAGSRSSAAGRGREAAARARAELAARGNH